MGHDGFGCDRRGTDDRPLCKACNRTMGLVGRESTPPRCVARKVLAPLAPKGTAWGGKGPTRIVTESPRRGRRHMAAGRVDHHLDRGETAHHALRFGIWTRFNLGCAHFQPSYLSPICRRWV
jgi:hypothetical protein